MLLLTHIICTQLLMEDEIAGSFWSSPASSPPYKHSILSQFLILQTSINCNTSRSVLDFVIYNKHHTPQSPGSQHLLPHRGCMTCCTCWSKHSCTKPPMPPYQSSYMYARLIYRHSLHSNAADSPTHSPINFCLRCFHYITPPSCPTSPSRSQKEVTEYTKALAWNVVLPLGTCWLQSSASHWDGSHHGPQW